jgi:hypothetical protein
VLLDDAADCCSDSRLQALPDAGVANGISLHKQTLR